MMKNYFSLNHCFSAGFRLFWQKNTALLLFFVLFGVLDGQAQIGVTIDNPTNTTPNLAASYPSLALALTDLNTVSAMTGPVTLTLAAGSEVAPPTGLAIGSATLNPVLSATNTVTLVASGGVILTAGVGTATPGSAAPDGLLKIIGADWVTIDGLTFIDGNVANPATMEFGVGLFKLSLSDGALNNTIKNCVFNMQRVNNAAGTSPMVDGSVGILMINATDTAAITPLVPTTAAGSNSNNKFFSNAINGGNIGMALIGYAASAPFTAADTNNDIGGGSLATGNSILNFGGGAVTNPAAGIRTLAQYGINISYNTVNNNNGSGVNHGATLRGIYLNTATSASATVNNNIVTVKSAATTSALTAIENASGATAASNTININNNTIDNCAYLTATSGTFTGVLNSASAAIVNINGNSISNNTIGTTGTASSCTFQGISNSASLVTQVFSASSNTISNNNILNSFGTFYGIRGNTQVITCNLNTISNVAFPNGAGASSIVAYGIYDLSSPTTENYTNNTISNFTISGSSTSTSSVMYGIHSNTVAASNVVYSGNTISGFTYTNSSTGSAALRGISLTTGATVNIFKNKIFDFNVAGAGSTVSGILIGGGTTSNTYNNIIGNLSTPSANLANPLIGINITGGTSANVYYNTVYLNGSSTGALFGSSAISVSTTPTVTLRNNIFTNTSAVMGAGLAVAYRRSSTTLTSYGAASNNNLFFASTIFTDGTNTDATLAAFKTRVAGRDGSSITENPVFVSTTGVNPNFLHIDTTVATQIESGGAAIATYTDDFDGNVRNASTPDIGADEFSGIISDLTGPSIVHTQLGNTCTAGNRTISATITDLSGVPTVGVGLPSLYWRINAGAYNLASGVSMGAGVYDFSVGTGSVVGDVITYYFVAQDNAGTPNLSALPSAGAAGFTPDPPAVSTVPTTPFSYSVVNPMNGTYTIGLAGNYTTLTAAVADYNGRCLTGPVTFSLLDATYPTETFPIVIQNNSDANSVNTLTIKPDTGVTASLTGSNAVAIIKLNGADYVIIDGSNNGTTSKDLSISNTNAGTSSTVVWISSTAAANGSTNNTVKNTIITGNTAPTTLAGIIVSGSVVGSVAEVANTGNVFQNNTVSLSQYGIGVVGPSTFQSGTVITQNTIGTVTNAIGFRGLFISNDNNTSITNNTVQNLVVTTGTASSAVFLAGATTGVSISNNTIKNINCSGTSSGINSISAITVNAGNTNTTINANTITGIASTTASGYGVRGITIVGNGTTVTNNMISDVWNYQDANALLYATIGISIDGAASNVILNNNSVNLFGAHTGYASNPTGGIATCIFINTTGTGLDIRNNILNNSYENSSSTGDKSYAIYTTSATNTQFATIDFNDYFVVGNSTPGTPFLGYLGSDRTTLADVITGFGGNASSINVAPVFMSATDLHLDTTVNINLDNLGTPIVGVTADIDGDLRNATTPDMGADEFTGPLAVADFDSSSFSFYPNPVKNILNLSYSQEMANVKVYNLMGQQVLDKNINATTTQIDMSGLSNGAYFIKVTSEKTTKTVKVIKN